MIDKDTMVVMPTPMKYGFRILENGRVEYPRTYTQYLFRLEDALRYLSQVSPYLAEALIFYNVPVRDELRQVGIHALTEYLKSLCPDDEGLASVMDACSAQWERTVLADYDIQICPVTQELQFAGHAFQGLDDLLGQVEISASGAGEAYISRHEATGIGLHVGETSLRYPCFDSEDYASEDRCYRNFIIRQHPVGVDEIRRFHAIKPLANDRRVHELVPRDMLPMVYYDGEGGFMLVATDKEQGLTI